jgi:hypothetical protein
MTVESKTTKKLRADWATVFSVLKAAAPDLFGSKLFSDVKYIGNDNEDQTFILIEFKEE